MYAALTPNLYVGQPPFHAEHVENARSAAALVQDGLTVWVTDIDTGAEALRWLGLDPIEVHNAVTAVSQGLTAVYRG